MKRKIVKTGSSLAVTLPREVVNDFNLAAGDEVDVSVHPRSGAIIIRADVNYFDKGKVTRRFKEASRRVLDQYGTAFEKLAK